MTQSEPVKAEAGRPRGSTRRTAAAARRRAREQEILRATRDLLDDNGVRDAQIEDIARAVGVNRAIIYRHFSGKEELFALTLVTYLGELHERLERAVAGHDEPADRLVRLTEAFCDYGLEFPAFVDCAQTLMRRPGPELLDEISEGALVRLGRGIASCLALVRDTLRDGAEAGVFGEHDPDVLANHMYASGLGALQLARVGMLVREEAPGVPAISTVSPDQVKRYVVATASALAAR